MGAARGAFAAGVPIEKHHVALHAEPPVTLSVVGGGDVARKIVIESFSRVRSARRADSALVAGVVHRFALLTVPPVRLLTHDRNLPKRIGRRSPLWPNATAQLPGGLRKPHLVNTRNARPVSCSRLFGGDRRHLEPDNSRTGLKILGNSCLVEAGPT